MTQPKYNWMLPSSNGLAQAGAQPIQSNFITQPTASPNFSLAGGNTGFPAGSVDALNLNGVAPGGELDFGGAMSNFSLGAQGISGLAGAYNAYKQMGLMEEQLNLQKGTTNRNIANTSATTNRLLDDRASMAAQLTSGAEYGTPEYLAAKEKLQTTVDGSPVA